MNIRQLAELAGVSRSTVSRVLNGRDDVDQETRRRVLAIMDQVGYKPEVRTSRGNVGVFVSRFSSEWFRQVLSGLLEASFETDWRPSLHPMSDILQAESVPQLCRKWDLSALVVVAPPRFSPVIERLGNARVPHVVLQASYDDPRINWVDIDHRDVSAKVTRFLLDRGHRKVAVLAPQLDTQWLHDRIQGYRTALEEAGVAYDETLVAHHSDESRPLASLVSWWLASGVTAIFCLEYHLSLACHSCLRRLGVAIPDEVSIVGFGDFHIESHVSPQISTVSQPAHELGRTAMWVLKSLLAGERPPIQRTLKATFTERDTTGPAPKPAGS